MRALFHYICPVALITASFLPLPSWSCSSDPNWQNTLRCQAFPGKRQTPPPPPTPPQMVDEIGDFTRVGLPLRNADNEVLRCVDGTQPIIYVDAAKSGSNDWLITFQGGGSCSDGQSCLDDYLNPNEHSEMGSAFQPAMKNMSGIHSAKPDNGFSEYNRVRIHKCGYDRYNGTTTVRNVSGTVDIDLNQDDRQGEFINGPNTEDYNPLLYSVREGDTYTFDLFHQGKKHILHTLDQLKTGLSYVTWVNENDEVAENLASLPPLQNARKILFAGHSGAAHGLMNNIDDLTDYMSGWLQSTDIPFEGDVRALFDAQFLPSVESETAFNEHLNNDPTNPLDVYDHLTQCQSPCESGPPLHYTYDANTYFSSGGVGGSDFFDGPYQEWNVSLDTSCLAAHPSSTWRCADRFHVLFNHMTTPFFIREDFRDPNGQHNNNPAGPENHGHRLFWADADIRHCSDPSAPDACLPVLSEADFRVRLEEQSKRLINDLANRSELALNNMPIPTVYLWLPDCASHAGAFDTDQFFNVALQRETLLTETTMHDFLLDFMNDVPTAAFNSLIDGNDDVRSICW